MMLLLESLQTLQADFLGISFSYQGFVFKSFQFLAISILFIGFYFIGEEVVKKFFRNFQDKDLTPFANLILGYSVFSYTIFAVGYLGLLYKPVIFGLLLLIVLIVILKRDRIILKFPNFRKIRLISFLICLTFFIGFLRLIPPQTAGDPLDYHLRFPRLYIENHSIMLPSLGDESYISIPQLPEMTYIASEVISRGEASRIIHFIFFAIFIYLVARVNILNRNEKRASEIAALLLATAPVLFKISTAAFSDIPAVIALYVCIAIITQKKLNIESFFLSGIIFGISLASKIWILYYVPLVLIILFLNIRNDRLFLKKTLGFLLASLIVISPWYIRGFLLSGNPFNINDQQGQIGGGSSLKELFFANLKFPDFFYKFNFGIRDFGPFYIGGLLLGILFRLFRRSELILLIFTIIFAVVIPIPFAKGRYAIPYMVILTLAGARGIESIIDKKALKILFYSLIGVCLSYYFINTIVSLPYGLGWASQKKYLERSLIADTKAYYDFKGKFHKMISDGETLVTYGMNEFYYANFKYKNLYYYFDQQNRALLLPDNIKKILIRGGDFNWVCNELRIQNCNSYKVSRLAFDSQSKLYLYSIKYSNED